jgi:hypothetical protein
VFDDEGNETDDVAINFKMNATRIDKKTEKVIKMRPRFFDSQGEAIKDENVPQIWGGSILKVSAQLNPFYTDKAGAGVSLRLSGVQIIKLVTGGGSTRAEDHGFGAEEDGEFQSGDAPASEDSTKSSGEEGGGDDAEF